MNILKKNIYNKLIRNKNLPNIYTSNFNKNITISNYLLKKKTFITLYYIIKDNNKYNIKEISGILIKKNKTHNLTNLHLICFKKYNNIYYSFLLKESPNIYSIKI